ncbi:MAG: DNA-binding protein [Candidatus Aenigmatarchaeota archaeon]
MNNQDDIQRLKEIEILKKTTLGKILSKDATERLSRLKLVKPDMANQLELYLVQLYQNGQIKKVINDDQLKNILTQISQKTEFKIRR